LARHRLHLIQNRLAVVRQLGVDDHDASVGDPGGGVAALAGNHVEVLGHFLGCAHRREAGTTAAAAALSTLAAGRRLLRARSEAAGGDAETHDQSKHEGTSHESSSCAAAPPGLNWSGAVVFP